MRNEERLELYRRHRDRVGEQILRSVLRMHASVEAAQTANFLIQERLGLIDVSLDVHEVLGQAALVLKAELTAILAKSAYLPRRSKHELVDRLIARMLPRRDDVPGSAPERRQDVELSRVEQLESRLKREIESISRESQRRK